MKREFRCERKEVDIEIERQRTREIYEGEGLWGGPGSPLPGPLPEMLSVSGRQNDCWNI